VEGRSWVLGLGRVVLMTRERLRVSVGSGEVWLWATHERMVPARIGTMLQVPGDCERCDDMPRNT
jgi:hypothetical protein